MTRLLIGILFLTAMSHLAAQPYVFYKHNKVFVETVDSTAVTSESFPLAEKEQHKVEVRFRENKDWNFSVNLKKITNDACETKSADTVLFISDMEGEFGLIRKMLIANRIIDENYNWVFGTNEVVICGDLFDRGTEVTEELWLLYKLESDAKAAGGSVHIVLGNHEIMNMSGDVRYVQPIYFEHARLLGKDYTQLFDESTELGLWLRSKNIIEKTGRFLCMHAGMSSEVLRWNLSIPAINEMVRPWYARAKADVPDNLSDFFNSSSPFWYRGYFDNLPNMQKLVTATLKRYDVDKIVVGHTILNTVSTFYNSDVWVINTNWHDGNAQGLLVEKDKYYRVDERGMRTLIQ
jgi:hypothetical protein